MAELRAARLARARQAEDQFRRRWLTDQYHELRRKTAEFDAKLIADVDKLTTGNAFLDYVLKAAIFRPIVVGFSMTSGGDPGRALASAKEWDGLPIFSTLHQVGNISQEGMTWGNGLGLFASFTDAAPGFGIADNAAIGGIKIALNHGDEVVDASKIAVKSGKELLEDGGKQALRQADESSNLWKVGSYREIKGTEAGLDAHHVGQKAVMKKIIPDYDKATAPAILVPREGHTRLSATGQIVSRNTSGLSNARQVLARDIRELRRVYPDIPNSALEELIQLNKAMYPGTFVK